MLDRDRNVNSQIALLRGINVGGKGSCPPNGYSIYSLQMESGGKTSVGFGIGAGCPGNSGKLEYRGKIGINAKMDMIKVLRVDCLLHG